MHCRRLYLILGDQLDHCSPILSEADPQKDCLWMAENAEEAEHVWCHQLRLVFFFSAMRHHRDWLREKGWTVHYTALPDDGRRDRGRNFSEILRADVRKLCPEEVRVVQPGDHRVRAQLETFSEETGITLTILDDPHFFLPLGEFKKWAHGRRSFLMETFYRMMRKRTGILVQKNGKPVGGEWNFDRDNRQRYPKGGPPLIKKPRQFSPDDVTPGVIELVSKRFESHPGSAQTFDLPVDRSGALAYLRAFVAERLPTFGEYQDAMWEGEHFGSHSRLSALLNVKLLSPREVVDAALEAYETGSAPLNAVEGFIRQILGWREYVRGIYYQFGEDYLERNELKAEEELPSFFWDGKTRMKCAADAMRNVMENGYAHHIQRLMVLGLFAQLWGANPRKFHDWHMAMYLDAIDWVSAPNTIGMSQYGDGGIVGTKPYCATGRYINKMSNYCGDCSYRPDRVIGKDACPFSTLYYDFLERNRRHFEGNRRMTFQLKNLERKSAEERSQIQDRVRELRSAGFAL